MNDLNIIKQHGGAYIDSREVAEVIGKAHRHLLRDIRGYCDIMANSIKPNFGLNDFFLESTYIDSIGRTLPCYLLSKMGCEMVANKLTGEKGILFTAAYVAKFNDMEQRELAELEARLVQQHKREPRLGEINACARLLVKGMKSHGASPEKIMRFLVDVYEPLGFEYEFEPDDVCAPRWHNANGIAKECGIYSLNGKPHGQAVARILRDVICIDEEHKRIETDYYGFQVGISTLYDDYALVAVMQWLIENELPESIEIYGTTYRVQYVDV